MKPTPEQQTAMQFIWHRHGARAAAETAMLLASGDAEQAHRIVEATHLSGSAKDGIRSYLPYQESTP